jgi:hypothetical protein
MRGPIPRARGAVVLSVHHGPADRAWPELTRALTVRCYGAPKLTVAARGGRGQRRGAHRGQNRAAVLGVEQVEAQRSETWSGMSCGVVP